MTLVPCEHCDELVAGLFRSDNGHGPWRLIPHKYAVELGRFTRVDWCPGKFERQEAKR
jgi:hypothetical protein